MYPPVQTSPGPIFGARDEPCAQCIAFDVSNQREQMVIALHREVFVAALPDVASRAIFFVVVARMGRK